MTKKFLSALLAVLMVISMVPVAAMAATDETPAAPDVIAAPLGTNTTAGTGTGYVDADYGITLGTAATEGDVTTIPVTFAGTNLKSHKSATAELKGYFVGIGIKVPDGATVKTAWGEYNGTSNVGTVASSPDGTVPVGYSTYYFDVGPNNPSNTNQTKKTGFVAVTKESKTTVYQMDFTAVMKNLAKTTITAGFGADGNVVDKQFFDELYRIRHLSADGQNYEKPSETWTEEGPNFDSEKDSLWVIVDNLDLSETYKLVLSYGGINAKEIETISNTARISAGTARISAGYRNTLTGIGASLSDVTKPEVPDTTPTYTYALYKSDGKTLVAQADGIQVAKVVLDADGGVFDATKNTEKYKKDNNKNPVTFTGSDSKKTAATFYAVTGGSVADYVTAYAIGDPTKESYTFKGWDTTTINGSVTVKAQWEKEPSELTIEAVSPAAKPFEESYGAKTFGDLQKDVTAIEGEDGNFTLSGQVKYIENWTAYPEAEQNGLFAAVKVKVSNVVGDDKVFLSTPTTEAKWKDITAGAKGEGEDVIFRIANFTNKKATIKVGKTAETATQSWTIDLSQLTEVPMGLDIDAYATNSANILGKGSSDIQTGIGVSKGEEGEADFIITGTAKYVMDWEGFSSKPEEHYGHFVALTFACDDGVTLKVKGGPTLDPDGILVKRIENFTSDKVLTIVATKNGKSKEYTVDYTDVTLGDTKVTAATNIAENSPVKVSVVDGVIVLTGVVAPKEDGTYDKLNLKVKFDCAPGTENSVEVTITENEDKTLTATAADVKGAKIPFNTDNLLWKDPASEAIPATPAADVKAPDKAGMNDAQAAVADAVHSVISGKGAIDIDLTAVAVNEANEEKTTVVEALADDAVLIPAEISKDNAELSTIAEAIETVKNDETGTPTVDTVKLVVQVYMAVEIKAVEATGNAESATPTAITLSITPMKQKVLAPTTVKNEDIVVYEPTAEGDNADTANAVKVGDPEPVDVDVPTEVTIKLPDSIPTGNYAVKHEKTDKEGNVTDTYYYYDGTVSGAEGASVLNFISKHGFSNFTLLITDPRVAFIGEGEERVGYDSLEAAVNAVAAGGEIKLITEPDEAITVTTDKSFKLTVNEAEWLDKVTVNTNVSGKKVSKSGPVDNEDGTTSIEYSVVDDKRNPIYPGVNTPGGSTNPGGPSTPSTSHEVKVPATVENGKITVSPTSAKKGDTVTITATPDEGYELDTVTVTDAAGKTVAVSGTGNKRTFTMPDSAVNVSATFKKAGTSGWKNPFNDVGDKAWYFKAVQYVNENGLMNGSDKGEFLPENFLKRSEFAQILYNKAGTPAVTGSSNFTDVPANAWYANAINWAAKEGVMAGVGNGKAAPNKNITREELASLLWRYEGKPAPKGTTLNFKDAGKISGWAKTAMQWAVENGVMNGTDTGYLNPTSSAKRAEAAQMLMNYFSKK